MPGLWGGLIAFWPQCKYLHPHLAAWARLNNLWPCSALSHWQGTAFWRAFTACSMIWLQWRNINRWSCVMYGPWCGNLKEWMCQGSTFFFLIFFWGRKLQEELKYFILSFPTFLFSALCISLLRCTSQWVDDEFSIRCMQWSAGVFFPWESCEFYSQQGAFLFCFLSW